ncbi:unnamed protein product [Porites evermanni]|uniref:Ig-like domain-containing protein n=1 Tax=Porites evermanni TaxID=104178 RepID=A0ABN8MVF6_9CNID|nr:unnamed protein product [Porites evermanni]
MLSSSGVFAYRCQANNTVGAANSTTVTIIVGVKPTVTFKRCPTPVTEGNNATLYCNATGCPVPNVAWINASSGNIESSTKTLVITAITRSERGSYICHASNEIGNGTQTCEIDVYYRPSSSAITTIPSNTTVLRGSNVSFTCTTDANPPANMYHFYFKGSLIESNSSDMLRW